MKRTSFTSECCAKDVIGKCLMCGGSVKTVIDMRFYGEYGVGVTCTKCGFRAIMTIKDLSDLDNALREMAHWETITPLPQQGE